MSTMRIRNAANNGWLDAATVAGFRVRNSANTGWVTGVAGTRVRNADNTGWLTFGAGGGPTYSVTPSVGSVNEGSTVTYSITTTGFGTGTLYWTNAGSTVGSDFSDGQNSGSIAITADSGSLTRTLSNDVSTEGSESVVLQLRTGSTSGTVVATASTVTVNDTSTTGSAPTQLSLYYNGLDFYYLPVETSSVEGYNDLICTVNTGAYYTNGADHLVFALDCIGNSDDPGADHCGPVIRNGERLWDMARGFIIYGNGTVKAEQWLHAGLNLGDVTNTSGGTFNPATTPQFTVRIKAGYRSGIFANQMTIRITSGDSIYGTLLFEGSVPWGWDWSGSHKVAIAGIAIGPTGIEGFNSPNNTGCVESLVPRYGSGAVVPFSNFDLRLF